MRRLILLLLPMLSCICTVSIAQTAKQKAIKSIIAAEHAFAKMAADSGIQVAFTYYAAPDAIIKRGNDSLIYGRAAVAKYYGAEFYKQASVSWVPDFTDAAENGDMGYTIGKYTWVVKDEKGQTKEEYKGIFHTVWKRQPDGSWKFVWD